MCAIYFAGMPSKGIRVLASALRHCIAKADILHAIRLPLRILDQDDGITFIIGPSRSGELLEIAFRIHEGELVTFHAMRARDKYLR